MTAWIGKNHNTPAWETSAAGPFDRWANGLGFDYFYGFNGGDMDHWNPVLFENRNLVPHSSDPNYHLTADLADHAIAWARRVKGISPDRPFFLYVAPGATHSPHHAPKEWSRLHLQAAVRVHGQDRQGDDRARAGGPHVPHCLAMKTRLVRHPARRGTFGGQVPTPNLDRVAKMGLRYTRRPGSRSVKPRWPSNDGRELDRDTGVAQLIKSRAYYFSTSGKNVSGTTFPRPLSWRVRGEECLLADPREGRVDGDSYTLVAVEPGQF